MTSRDPASAARVWLEQGRPDRAERELRRLLSEDPHDGMAHTMLSSCLTALRRYDEALSEAKIARSLMPSSAGPYCALAEAYSQLDNLRSARVAINEAIRLDPGDADSWVSLAGIELGSLNRGKSVEAADKALSLDPTHVGAMQAKAMALNLSGKTEEAERLMKEALAADPNESTSHGLRGLMQMAAGRDGSGDMLESLRLDPSNDHARSGLIGALKAQRRPFGLVVQLVFAVARLPKWLLYALLALISVGGPLTLLVTFLSSGLGAMMRWVYLTVCIAIYVGFVSVPLFNLFLFMHPRGRYALTSRERVQAIVVAGCLVLAGVLFATSPLSPGGFSYGAVFLLLYIIPLAETIGEEHRESRLLFILVTTLLGLIGVASMILFKLAHIYDFLSPLWFLSLVAFAGGLVLWLSLSERVARFLFKR